MRAASSKRSRDRHRDAEPVVLAAREAAAE
jgi:hypothetical protein